MMNKYTTTQQEENVEIKEKGKTWLKIRKGNVVQTSQQHMVRCCEALVVW